MKRKRKKGRGRKSAANHTETLGRGIVTLSIAAGACLWGYALVNLATRTL